MLGEPLHDALEERRLPLFIPVATRLQGAILGKKLGVSRKHFPGKAMMSIPTRPDAGQDDVDLRWPEIAERRPVFSPLVFEERWVHGSKTSGRGSDVRDEHDQIEVVRIEAAYRSATGQAYVGFFDEPGDPTPMLVDQRR